MVRYKENTNPVISGNGLSFKYGDNEVFTGVSVNIGRGERWAIIGRNGAGKSTLLRCLAGLEYPFIGEIEINGKPLRNYAPRQLARLITYVPQIHGFGLPYTVGDYVMMGRFSYQGFLAIPSAEDRKTVEQALELTHTEYLSERIMNTLSGGELQRVLLAGAVAQRTEVLLLDEPATFLDPLHQALLQKALEKIHDEFGTAIITVTHDINNVLSWYSNVIALCDKSLHYAGETSALKNNSYCMLKDIYGIDFEEAELKSTGKKAVFSRM